jgi:hypothetical protein
MRWILKDAGGQEIGAFEGDVQGKVTDYTVTPRFAWAGVVHVVFRGSGVFEGQKMVLEGTRTKIVYLNGTIQWKPLDWKGFLLKKTFTLSFNQAVFSWRARFGPLSGEWNNIPIPQNVPTSFDYKLAGNKLHTVIGPLSPPRPGTEVYGNSTYYVYKGKGVWVQNRGETVVYTSSQPPHYLPVTLHRRGYLKFDGAPSADTFVHGVMYQWGYVYGYNETTVKAAYAHAVWDSKMGGWHIGFAIYLWDKATQTYDTVAPFTNPGFPSPMIEPLPDRNYNPLGL